MVQCSIPKDANFDEICRRGRKKKKVVAGFDFVLLSQTEKYCLLLLFGLLGSFCLFRRGLLANSVCFGSILGAAFMVVVVAAAAAAVVRFSLFLFGCRLGKCSLSFFLVQKFYNL